MRLSQSCIKSFLFIVALLLHLPSPPPPSSAAYCLSYDSNTQPRDLHATMTDKCCQCRRGASRVSQSLMPIVASFPARESGELKDEAGPAEYEVQPCGEMILKS